MPDFFEKLNKAVESLNKNATTAPKRATAKSGSPSGNNPISKVGSSVVNLPPKASTKIKSNLPKKGVKPPLPNLPLTVKKTPTTALPEIKNDLRKAEVRANPYPVSKENLERAKLDRIGGTIKPYKLTAKDKTKEFFKETLPTQSKAFVSGLGNNIADPFLRAAYEVQEHFGIQNNGRLFGKEGGRGEYLSLLAKYNEADEGKNKITDEELLRLKKLESSEENFERWYTGLPLGVDSRKQEDLAKIKTSENLGAFTGEMFSLWIGGEILGALSGVTKLEGIRQKIINLLTSTTNFAVHSGVSSYGKGDSNERIAKETVKGAVFGSVSDIVKNVVKFGGTKLLAKAGVSTDIIFGNQAARVGVNLGSNVVGMESGLLASNLTVGDDITLDDVISTAIMAVTFGTLDELKLLTSKNPQTGKSMFSTIKETRKQSNILVDNALKSSLSKTDDLLKKFLNEPSLENYNKLNEHINGETNKITNILGNHVYGENEFLTSKGGKKLKDTLTGYLQLKNIVNSPYLNGAEPTPQSNTKYSYSKPGSVVTGLNLPQVSSISFGDKSESGLFVDKLIENQGKIKSENIFNVDKMYLLDTGKTSESIYNYFKKIGGIAVNPTLGEVELTKRGAKDTVHHGIGDDKFIATAAVKDVIEKGDIIDHAQNWKGRGYDTYVIAGRGKINNANSIVGVIVKSYPNDTHKNKFYLHEVIKIGDDSISFPKNPQHHVTDMAEDISEVINELSPNDNISQTDNVVNNQYMQNNGNNTDLLSAKDEQLYERLYEMGLTTEEQYDTLRYKGFDSYLINSALRNHDSLSDDQSSFVGNLNSALDKFPVYKGTTYRNIGFKTKEMFDNFIRKNKWESVIKEDAFISASKDVDGYVVDLPYKVHYEIVSYNGRDISSVGILEEVEVLFKSGTEFLVKSFEVSENHVKILYEEKIENGKELRSSISKTANRENGNGTFEQTQPFRTGNKNSRAMDSVREGSTDVDIILGKQSASDGRSVEGKDTSDSLGLRTGNRDVTQTQRVLEHGSVKDPTVVGVKTANDGYPLIYVKEVVTNGKNMETDNRGNGESTTGTDNEGQRGNATGEGDDLRGIQEYRGIPGNGGEVGESQVFESAEVGNGNVEQLNRIKELSGRRARTVYESRELVDLLYNQFGKDIPEFADVRDDISSPIYFNHSSENISHIVNNLVANENYLYELKKEAGKIKKALEPSEKQMEYINKIAKGEASLEEFSPVLGLDKFQSLIDAQEKVFEVENNGIKKFKETTRLNFKDTVEDFIKNSDEWKDKFAFGWQINTAERNAYDTMGKDADKFIDLFITPMKQNEAQKIRYINEHKQTIKDLELTPEEFKPTMLYGEGIIRNASPKIQNAAKVFNEIAEQIKNDVNATLVLNGYKPIDNPKINLNANEFRDALSVLTGEKQYEQMLSDKIRQFVNIAQRYGIDSIQYDSKGKITASVNIPYFPHGEVLDNLQQVKKAMGFSLEVSELPGEITGRTEEFKPNKKWVGNLEKRRGKKTDYDIKNWDNYINNISEVIYHTSDITKLRLLENGLRNKYSQSQIDEEVKIARNLMTNEELEDFFATLDQKKNELTKHNNLINWLNEYTNIIAGKKHSADRNMEKNILGREFYNLMTTLERNWAVNQVGGNVSSVFNQFSQLTSLLSEKNPIDVLTAVGTAFFGDSTALKDSDYMITKDGSIKLTQNGIEKIANVMFKLPMTAENITSKLVWQTAYNEAIRKGKTESQAKAEANKYASQIMADRTKIGLPTIFASKNILKKFLTTFQIEPANTFFHYIKDLPREAKGKGIMWLIKSAMATALMNWLFNKGKEKLTGGGNVTLDPLETGIKVYQWIADKEGVEFADVLESIKENVANLPFMQTPMVLLGVDDVGQIPMTNMIPDIPETVEKFKSGRFADGAWDIADTVVNSFNPLGGYSQFKKTVKGIGAVLRGAEYTPSGDLRYPIERSAGNFARGILFGKYSLPENKEFRDNNKDALNEKETAEWEYRVQQGENPIEVYNEIYQRKVGNSSSGTDYNDAVNEKVNEFDFGMALELDKLYREYKENNPKASKIGVPSASETFNYNGDEYKLTVEECAELQNRYNTEYYNRVEGIINDSTLSNDEKYEKVKEMRKEVVSSVKESFAKEYFNATGFNEDEQKEYDYRVKNGENAQDVYDEIYQRKVDAENERIKDKEYSDKVKSLVKEFDYGSELAIEKILDEYRDENPDADTIRVPTASKEFSYKKQKYDLTAEQYADLQSRYNESYYEAIEGIINDSSLSNSQKYERIVSARKTVRDKVKDEFAREVLGYVGYTKQSTKSKDYKSTVNGTSFTGKGTGNTNYKKIINGGTSNSSSGKTNYKRMINGY